MAKLTNRKMPGVRVPHCPLFWRRLLPLLNEVIAQLDRVEILEDLAVAVAVRRPAIQGRPPGRPSPPPVDSKIRPDDAGMEPPIAPLSGTHPRPTDYHRRKEEEGTSGARYTVLVQTRQLPCGSACLRAPEAARSHKPGPPVTVWSIRTESGPGGS
jgi:hypothetical protein